VRHSVGHPEYKFDHDQDERTSIPARGMRPVRHGRSSLVLVP